MSPLLSRIMESAVKEADLLKDEYLSTEHFFLAMLKEPTNEAGRILRAAGVTDEAALKALAAVPRDAAVTDPQPEAKFQALDKYARDLTAAARQGKLDP